MHFTEARLTTRIFSNWAYRHETLAWYKLTFVMSDIYLYAEILAHIGQVSLYASLQTAKDEETRINISSDRHTITVSHDGDKSSMFLPTGIGGNAEVTIPAERKLDLSLRLELDDVVGLPSLDELKSKNEYPWLAEDLRVDTSICCKSCQLEIIKPGDITIWKDLPSEGWAEMMDLWHCHKPQDEHADSSGTEAAAGKGYAPSSHISAARQTGLIDVSTFLFDKGDCHNVQLNCNTIEEDRKDLHCTGCSDLLGLADPSVDGWRLSKSSVALKSDNTASWESFPATSFVCAQLLALIESQAIRRFVLHSGPRGTTGAFLLWVFNPALLYTSSKSTPGPHIGMKIFYQSVDDPRKLLDEPGNAVEELYLPVPGLQEFITVLKQSTTLLPQSARKFKEWSVGLLDRYQRDPMSMDRMTALFKPLFTSQDQENESERFKSIFTKEIEAQFKPLYD